jgi:DNA-binding NtrC family response regulator
MIDPEVIAALIARAPTRGSLEPPSGRVRGARAKAPAKPKSIYKQILAACERAIVTQALQAHGGSKMAAAAALKISRQALHEILKRTART